MIILLILISATAIFNVINIGNKDNKDILSNKNDGLVVNEEIMINEEANAFKFCKFCYFNENWS